MTVGVYNSGHMKCNGVLHEHLADHIEYNLQMRPGRAFFVDGICLNKGYLTDEKIADALVKINALKPFDRGTAPYV